MNPESWRSISTVFLIVGIVFFVLTVWLSVKFNLISIIKSELNNRKERQSSDENDYFIVNGNSESRNNTDNTVSSPSGREETNTSNTVLAPVNEESNTSNTVLAPVREESNTSNTVLATPHEESNLSNTVFVSGENNDTYEENDDFIISENIIVIHGDPSSIRRKVVL